MNPNLERELKSEVAPFLGRVAAEMADTITSQLPYPAILGGVRVSASGGGLMRYTTRSGNTRLATRAQVANWTQGREGGGPAPGGDEEVKVTISGPGWHLWEFGTVNHGPRPAIRPGAQAAMSRYGGRWRGL